MNCERIEISAFIVMNLNLFMCSLDESKYTLFTIQ